MSEKKLMNQVRMIRRKGYLTGVEIYRVSESLRDPADGPQRMVGVENRELGVESIEKSRQEEEGNGDGAVKDEEQEHYTVNPDTVVGGHAGEMIQRDNECLKFKDVLMNAPEENIAMNTRRVDKSMINKVAQKINADTQTEDITQTRNLPRAIVLLVGEKLQLKRKRNGGEKEPWWGNDALKRI
ncbi:Hypothetical predicted protein [Octopus vulgaris]|uniref:Uncharacterized protein n=1 Tax=Octopus vulgaris TaxID=6645 RepID=A0AA36B040_OCTVU|nr:Hypothetical predicted protein [Octopus vulgaris]